MVLIKIFLVYAKNVEIIRADHIIFDQNVSLCLMDSYSLNNNVMVNESGVYTEANVLNNGFKLYKSKRAKISSCASGNFEISLKNKF